MKRLVVMALLLGFYAALIGPFKAQLDRRPLAIKLGYAPDGELMRMAAGDQKLLIGELLTLKVLFYFGSLVEEWKQRIYLPPEYYNMYKTIEAAVKLDPYNMDAYYFAQAAFNWEVGRTKEVNHLLEYGMRYRDWDYWLPFYVGFNEAYFLKNYERAAHFLQIAAEKSGNPLFAGLAARYFHEADQTPLALAFLDAMIAQSRDEGVRHSYAMRKEVLLSVTALQQTVSVYQGRFGRPPATLTDLVTAGLISKLPIDPYGGEFYLDEDSKVQTTSKFSALPQHLGAAPAKEPANAPR